MIWYGSTESIFSVQLLANTIDIAYYNYILVLLLFGKFFFYFLPEEDFLISYSLAYLSWLFLFDFYFLPSLIIEDDIPFVIRKGVKF